MSVTNPPQAGSPASGLMSRFPAFPDSPALREYPAGTPLKVRWLVLGVWRTEVERIGRSG
jgi:hypothetical protein